MSVHECLVGALLALASGKAERRQVHPLGEHQSKTSHRFHRCAQIRRVWHPAIPTPPSANPPTEYTEFTETTGGNILPRISQMPTDG